MNVGRPQPDGCGEKGIGIGRSPMWTNYIKCRRGLLGGDMAKIGLLIFAACIIHKPVPRRDATIAYAQLYNDNWRLSNGLRRGGWNVGRGKRVSNARPMVAALHGRWINGASSWSIFHY
jgi:hypothetical protein